MWWTGFYNVKTGRAYFLKFSPLARFLAQASGSFAAWKKNNVDYTKGGGENVRTNRRIIDHVVDCKMV
jgi:hypothetical protein